MADAFIYDAIRTPRGKGKQGGSLYEVKPIDLVTNLLEEMKERLNLDTSKVEDLILACGEPVKEQGQNIAKAALVYSSWDDITTGAQLHRFCAGGLDAVNMAAAKVASGFEELVAAGGVESMSRLGIGASGGATGDPWVAMKSYFISQGLGADMIATMDGISREEVDAYAARSQHRAAQARDNGYFKSIVPVRDMNGVVVLEQDELIRAETTAEGLAKLKPAFQMFNDFGHGGVAKLKYPELENIECVHTAGNSSGIVDGAGLVLIGSEAAGKEQGLTPRARIVSCALVGSEPTIMLDGPVPATQKALKKAGLSVDDIDLFELNEAFASVVLRYQNRLGIPDEKINVNGGAIAMGHPIGATGAMILGTLLDELERRDLKRGLVTLCAGGGIGIATIIERV
ncbi:MULTISPECIES: acetyl-CoA C-acetyltransferase [Spongiibacter]|jgi:acetyl-CoA C-acetyltransferase|uniref:acetyl-CoA C-acetyltransferase n=1 Tax=Spongiibacter TaxID=630749 RepID=UPI00196202D1|nr:MULTISPECIES: acetyl-CoA C-acetyltransferase [Spongiibacter]MBM7423146.1 acetyl-CoA C-acetyltransferase [Spongiibacter marinus]|tara:strand:+ start:1723 stop:2922 length:1200 start_codon:yes stop_codon:yes gene_type:complete